MFWNLFISLGHRMVLSKLYSSLCKEAQSRTGRSIRQVASTSRLSPGTIDLFLAHGGTPSYDRLLAISDALRIDRLRAQIALQVLGCPGSYYAPGTILASRLVARLAEAITHPDNEREEEMKRWKNRTEKGGR